MKYNVIVADPPWYFTSTAPRGEAPSGARLHAGKHYPLMKTEEICKLYSDSFIDLFENDSILFLWCPGSCIEDGLTVMRGWGFTYKKIGFVWVKLTERNKNKEILQAGWNKTKENLFENNLHYSPTYGWRKYAFGAGRTTRDGAEFCLIGTRGKMPPEDMRQRQVVFAPKGAHSQKPEEVQDSIETMYPNGRYIEIFARRERRNWTVWGNEV